MSSERVTAGLDASSRRPGNTPSGDALFDLASDDALLDALQRAAFGYFVESVNPANGLTPDNSRPNSPVSIAVAGFALSSYVVAVERGWLARAEAVDMSLSALRFFPRQRSRRRAWDDRLQGLLLPLPRPRHRRARLGVGTVDDRYRAADRRRVVREHVFRHERAA
jgi:hypothetical protein